MQTFFGSQASLADYDRVLPHDQRPIKELNHPMGLVIEHVVQRRGKPRLYGGNASRLRIGRASDLLELTPPIQFFHKGSRVAPASLDLDEEFEKHFGAYHLLDVEAGGGSDLLEHLAAFAEQDGFLAVAFAVNHSGNPGQPWILFELLDQDRNRVWHLFVRLHKNMLADQLRRHEAHRLIGDLIFREIARAVGQSVQHAREQLVEAFPLESGDGDDLLEIVQRLELRDQREQFGLVGEEIDFVEQEEDWSASLFCQVEDEAVFAVPLLLGIDNHQDQFAAF